MLYLVALFASLLAYFTLEGLYNLFLHPLRHIPGPIVNRFSSIPRHIATIQGRHCHILSSLHNKYGPVVRFAPNEISYITAQSWKDIYGHGRADIFSRHLGAYGVRTSEKEHILSVRDPKDHVRLRKAFNPAFTERAAREQETILAKYADQMIWRMGENAKRSSTVDLEEIFTFTTFDVISDLTFGESLHLLEQGESIPWVSIIFDGLKFAAWGGILQRILGSPLDMWIATVLLAPFKEKSARHSKFAYDKVDKRMQQTKTERPDFWKFIFSPHDEQEPVLSQEQVRLNSSVIIIGGSETSATCLCALAFYMMQDQDVYSKLVQEIRTTFRESSDINLIDLAKLPYLNACLKESLRIFPPAAAGLVRVVPRPGEQVDGIWLPGDTIVYTSSYAAYHNASNFHDPESFRPERWLAESGPFSNDNKAVFQPFSIGPRNCIGRILAWHEMRLFMAKALWHYDFELSDRTGNFVDTEVFVTWEKKHLIAKLKPVKR